MRMLAKNKQKMFYSMPTGKELPIYELDESGNIKYMEIDGVQVPVETGNYEPEYSEPVEFHNGIAGQLSKSVMKAFGIDDSTTYAQMDCLANQYPFGKGAYIWRTSEIGYKTNPKMMVDVSTADYMVENVLDEGINIWNYLLQRNLK